jgi:ComF family protein
MARSLNELSNRPAGKFDNARAGSLARAVALVGRALPQSCLLCRSRCGTAILCDPCMNTLPALAPSCPVCARPAPGALVCGQCLRKPPRIAATVAACSYAFPIDRLIQALKYAHELAVAQPLGDALAAAVLRAPSSYARPQAIVPLPLSRARQRERGFNQAIEIARVVTRRTGVPMLHALVRETHGPAQATLPWSKRRGNVRGAFACSMPVADRHLAILDDVMTTGATLEAAATALKHAGAARVDAWIVARTPPPGAA